MVIGNIFMEEKPFDLCWSQLGKVTGTCQARFQESGQTDRQLADRHRHKYSHSALNCVKHPLFT